tara:strand:- start:964 stop:1314 length:351 start_codon:yes stop_codon:yes gene_type:complete
MKKIILIQLASIFALAVLAGLIIGKNAFFSAIFGGLCCVLPNILFALRINYFVVRNSKLSAFSFFVGEFIKVLFTVSLVTLIGLLFKNLNWLIFIIALIVTLKSYMFLLLRYKNGI